MPSEPPRGFERHDPETWSTTLAYRRREELPYDLGVMSPGDRVMLDATVYIDAQKRDQLAPELVRRLADASVLHSAVALGEIAAGIGLLDPAHPGTPAIRAALTETLAQAPAARTVSPSAEAWTEAAVIAGALARIQGLGREQRRKLLNDALMFVSAAEADAVLVSRNRRDMDLLLRFRPDVRLLLYDVKQPPEGKVLRKAGRLKGQIWRAPGDE